MVVFTGQKSRMNTVPLAHNFLIFCPRPSRIRRLLGAIVIIVLSLHTIFTLRLKRSFPPFAFHHNWHPTRRSGRFPTVAQRVKLYMSNWYHPPCPNTTLFQWAYDRSEINASLRLLHVVTAWKNSTQMGHADHSPLTSTIIPDRLFFFDMNAIQECAKITTGNLLPIKSYCEDSIDFLEILEQTMKVTNRVITDKTASPVLGQFGDHIGTTTENLPLVTKFRYAASKKAVAAVTSSSSNQGACTTQSRPSLQTSVHGIEHALMSPIVWKLESQRHWNPLDSSRRQDIPWTQKRSGCLWRGDLTGQMTGTSDAEKCRSNDRCRFVLNNARSKIIDAGLRNLLGHVGDVVDGVQLVKDWVSMADIQKFKVIVSFEGNDVASGLKWSLLSQSVVVMAPPTRTSWAMEELLEPWVHYIPMHPNGSNAEEMVDWVEANDMMAQKIAERATLFMYDLVYHPDAAQEERAIKEEIVRRYRALWSSSWDKM